MRILIIFGLAALTACTHGSYLRRSADCPHGYVPIHTARGEFAGRAMSAGGVVIGVRVRPNDPVGSLEFWEEVIRKELTEGRGYAFRSAEELKEGRGLRFTVPKVKDIDYYLALLVSPQTITTVEISGPRVEMEKDLDTIKEWIERFELR